MSNAEQFVHPHTRTVRDGGYMKTVTEQGFTKRELFAAMIFQQFLQGAVFPEGFDASQQLAFAATRATESADALLAELAKDAAQGGKSDAT